MRLLSLHVQHYRVHEDCRIAFDPSRTLIGGPNESGKSTLVEAAHRALFFPYRRGGTDLDAMRSLHSNEPPEVTLAFEQGGTEFTLTKTFNGPKNSSRIELRDADHHHWSGAEAETRLGEVLGIGELPGNRANSGQWAHLWIRQGRSGEHPGDEVGNESGTLLARLQDQGGGAVMQSDLDARLARHFQAQAAAIFNQNGSPKAGSELKRAEDGLAAAEAEVARAEAMAATLEKAVADHRRASRQLAETTAALPELERQLETSNAKQAEARQLAERRAQIQRQHDDLEADHRSLRDADRQIVETAATLERERQTVATLGEKQRPLREQAGAAELRSREAAATRDRAADTTRAARRSLDLARAASRRFDEKTKRAEFTQRQKRIESLRSQLKVPRAALARLPEIEPDDLAALRQLGSQTEKSRSALEAMATGIEWLDGEPAPTLGGQPLVRGTPTIISDAADLVVGTTRMRLRPGGGTRLEKIRDDLRDAEDQLARSLAKLGAESVAHAAEIHEKRRQLGDEIRQLETRLEGHDAAELGEQIEACDSRLLALDTEIERLATGDAQPPPDAAAARAAESTAAEALARAESEENRARGDHKAATERAETLRRQLATTETDLQRHRDALAETETKHQLLRELHGEADAREKKLRELARTLRELKDQLEAATKRLAALQPELLEADHERLRRALNRQLELKSQAEQDRAAALATLRNDGSHDPHAELQQARESLAQALEEQIRTRRRAEAIRRLAALFREEQQQLADQFTAPLAARISDYLRCLFGPEASARVTLTDHQFQGIELLRPGGPFDFHDLSGGAREQLAAAVRLAIAEILATDHHGCLPVVFDDAFAQSDPERVHALQRMLDLAARRGLQLVLLSCDPGQYRSLGATELSL